MRALIYRKFVWVFIFLLPSVASASVVISEIMYDLPGTDTGREWIEIHNTGRGDVDLTGWKLFEAATNHSLNNINGGNTLVADGYAIIADDTTQFLVDWPSFSGQLFDSSFSLSNSGEALSLKDSGSVAVDGVTYDTSLGGAGDGNTLSLLDSSWVAQAASPGATNVSSVPDTIAPIITLRGESPQHVWSANSYAELGAEALDNVDGDISGNISVDASGVKNGEPGTYIVTYNVSDSSGNSANQVTRQVIIMQSSSGGGGNSVTEEQEKSDKDKPEGIVLGATDMSEEEKDRQKEVIRKDLYVKMWELLSLFQVELNALL
jgi:hypothetical protein